jgi:hypothetical protein
MDTDQQVLGLLIGRRLAQVQILAVNSLKTVEPPPASLVGEFVQQAIFTTDREFIISTGALTATVNLERVGRLVWLVNAGPWSPGQSAAPTIRVLTDDGSALDLTEPGRTKRITIAIRSTP